MSRRLKKTPFFPDPVVIEMAAHFWGMHSSYATADLQFESRSKHETLRDTVEWIRAHRGDCA